MLILFEDRIFTVWHQYTYPAMEAYMLMRTTQLAYP